MKAFIFLVLGALIGSAGWLIAQTLIDDSWKLKLAGVNKQVEAIESEKRQLMKDLELQIAKNEGLQRSIEAKIAEFNTKKTEEAAALSEYEKQYEAVKNVLDNYWLTEEEAREKYKSLNVDQKLQYLEIVQPGINLGLLRQYRAQSQPHAKILKFAIDPQSYFNEAVQKRKGEYLTMDTLVIESLGQETAKAFETALRGDQFTKSPDDCWYQFWQMNIDQRLSLVSKALGLGLDDVIGSQRGIGSKWVQLTGKSYWTLILEP